MIRSNHLDSAELVRREEYVLNEDSRDEIPHRDVLKLERRQHIISVLNLFEQIVVARCGDVGDADLIEKHFIPAIRDYFVVLKPFITAWENEMMRHHSWKIVEDKIYSNECPQMRVG